MQKAKGLDFHFSKNVSPDSVVLTFCDYQPDREVRVSATKVANPYHTKTS